MIFRRETNVSNRGDLREHAVPKIAEGMVLGFNEMLAARAKVMPV